MTTKKLDARLAASAAPPGRRRVGRPARISRDQILDEAQQIPIDDLTLPLLAERLGVRTPALYNHFESREALLSAVCARRLSELKFPKADSANWRKWLLCVATDLYQFLRSNPILLMVSDTRLVSSGLAMYEGALETLVGAGFSDEEATFIWNSVNSNVRTYATSHQYNGTAFAGALFDVLENPEADFPRVRAAFAAMRKNEKFESSFLNWLVSSLPEPKRMR